MSVNMGDADEVSEFIDYIFCSRTVMGLNVFVYTMTHNLRRNMSVNLRAPNGTSTVKIVWNIYTSDFIELLIICALMHIQSSIQSMIHSHAFFFSIKT